MSLNNVNSFNFVGLSMRTTNENEKSAVDIPKLWNKFLSEKIADKISDKTDSNIYCIYTEYEKDHTKPYTVLLGCKVDSLNNVPEGLTGKSFQAGKYQKFIAKGKLSEGVVFLEWNKIWNSDILRTYTFDFEVYGEKSQDPDNAEVEIYVAVK